jgi:hypothetical protein
MTQHYQTTLYHIMPNVFNAFLFWKWSRIAGYSHQHDSLLYMLQVTRRLQCTFQKDRIQALSGFATSGTSPNKLPEPRERTQVVYQKCARQVLGKMRTLYLLSAVQHKHAIQKLSWVLR